MGVFPARPQFLSITVQNPQENSMTSRSNEPHTAWLMTWSTSGSQPTHERHVSPSPPCVEFCIPDPVHASTRLHSARGGAGSEK